MAKGILCRVGLHRWGPYAEGSPFPIAKDYQNPTRQCLRCGWRERWLPGYGGSEIGCWVAAEFEPLPSEDVGDVAHVAARMRAAFDSDSLPEKNLALRLAHDTILRLSSSKT